MAQHQDDIIRFDVPRDWDNRTVVAYAAPKRKDGTSPANIVVRRQHHDGTLQQLVDQRVRALAARTHGFMLRGQRAMQLDGREGLSVSYCTEDAEKRMVVMPVSPGMAVIVTLSANTQDAPSMAPLFERILSSVALSAG